jgi:hypothetical protein
MYCLFRFQRRDMLRAYLTDSKSRNLYCAQYIPAANDTTQQRDTGSNAPKESAELFEDSCATF